MRAIGWIGLLTTGTIRSARTRRQRQAAPAVAAEVLEERLLLSAAPTASVQSENTPTLFGIPNTTLLAGSPLHIPLNGFDHDGRPLTFTAVSSNPDVATFIPEDNRSLRIAVADYGEMVFQLFEQRAPRVTAQIIDLAQSGFYDGVLFHRVIPGFVIQGGDPTGTGTGGSHLGQFDDQFHVDLQHNRTGLLSMAKSIDDSNDSQFFITEGPQRHLDFNHSIFGLMVEGEFVRSAISSVETDAAGRPLSNVVMQSVEIFHDQRNAVLMLKAPEGYTGETDITVTVTDPDGNKAVRSFHVSITPDTVNSPPFLADIPEIHTTIDTPVAFQLTAIDVEGDPAHFLDEHSLENNNLFVPHVSHPDLQYSVDFDTGLVTVVPTNGLVGTHSITVATAVSIHAVDYQVVPIYIHPVYIEPIADELMVRGQEQAVIDLTALGPEDSVPTMTAATRTYAEVLDAQLGLYPAATYSVNWGGLGEKWIRGAGNVWYFITPAGQLFRWTGSTIHDRELVATLDPLYHKLPSLLHEAHAYALDLELGLFFFNSYSEDWAGAGEKWIRGDGGAWYFILPNGELYEWDSTHLQATGRLVGTPGAYYHEHPEKLHEAAHADALRQQLDLIPSTNYSTNWGGLNEKWIRGSGSWFYILPDGRFFRWHGGSLNDSTLIATLHRDHYVDPALLHTGPLDQLSVGAGIDDVRLTITPPDGFLGTFEVIVTAVANGHSYSESFLVHQGNELLHQLDRDFRLYSTGNDHLNSFGLGEKWLRGIAGAWFFLTPQGDLYRWNGGESTNTTFLAALPEAVYHTPWLLYDYQSFVLDHERGLHVNGHFYFNAHGFGEKWLRGAASEWYYVTPSGHFYRWHGGDANNRTLVARLDPGIHADPRLLTEAQTIFLERQLKLEVHDGFHEDAHGLGEKWFQDEAGRWHYVLPDGRLYRFHGPDTLDRTLVARLDPAVHAQPWRLLASQTVQLDEQLGLSAPGGNLYENIAGLKEKWMLSSSGLWYYILPNGHFYRWLGGAYDNRALVARLHPSLHTNPKWLYDSPDYLDRLTVRHHNTTPSGSHESLNLRDTLYSNWPGPLV
jgi:cyclophilin family peptidyl-prolyl cis-trans isomerase